MIILIINQYSVIALERKCQPPIPADLHRPMTLVIAVQSV